MHFIPLKPRILSFKFNFITIMKLKIMIRNDYKLIMTQSRPKEKSIQILMKKINEPEYL